jgi:hypothetical protein
LINRGAVNNGSTSPYLKIVYILGEGSHIALMRSLVSAEGLHDRITGFMDYMPEQKKNKYFGDI